MRTRWAQVRYRPTGRPRGVSIFEVLIAFIILQTGLLISLQGILTGKAFGVQARKSTYATLVAQAKLEGVVRDAFRTGALPASGDSLTIPTEPEAVQAPAEVGDLEVTELEWQATITATDLPGLFDVSVGVSYYGMAHRRQAVVLSTRVFAGEGAAP